MNTELLQTYCDLQDFLFSMQRISTLLTIIIHLKRHVTPRTYIIASDHDELLGDKHDEYRRLVGERFTSTAQIGHRTNEQFTAPVTGDLWQLLNSLTKSQDGATR